MDTTRRNISSMTLDEAIAHAKDVAVSANTPCARQHQQLADWLEELRNIKCGAVGNAAKLREACQKTLDLLMRRGDGKCRCVLTWDEFNDTQMMLRAALSAMPRNCDILFLDRVEMYGAFKDWCKAKGHTMEPMLAYDAFDWLLASVTKEGEGNGSK